MISYGDVCEARSRVGSFVRETPVMRATLHAPYGDVDVVLKLEQVQVSGTFKARGSFNAVLHLRDEGRLTPSGLVIASGGNAGIAASMAGRAVGAPVTVVVPEGSPAEKVARLRHLGADVVQGGPTHHDTFVWAQSFAARTGAFQLHAYDQPDIVAGAGTLALESLDQVPGLGSIVVAVGGGGLVGGVATVGTERGFRTVAVEPTGAPSLHAALAAGEPVDVRIDTIAKDSLGARRVGNLAYQVCAGADVVSVLVEDLDIVVARELLWTEYRLLVEDSAAAAVAAICTGAYTPAGGELPVVVLCGANVAHQWPPD